MSIEKVTILNEKTVNQQDENGNTLLHHAALNGSTSYCKIAPNFEEIEKLLSLGVDITLKNKFGLTAGDLIFGNGDDSKRDNRLNGEVITAFCKHTARYSKLVMNYQPTFENIKCLLESEVLHYSNISVSELSQDCLEKLIIWCQQGQKTYKDTVIVTEDGRYIEKNVPKHLCFISFESLKETFRKELELLQKYPNLNQALEQILRADYREGILIALMQDKEIKAHFDMLFAQLKQLPIAEELKSGIQTLNKELQDKISKNYPYFVCLNEQGKTLIDSLFGELYETLFERQLHLDAQKATCSNRWKNTHADFLIERFNKHQSKHQTMYQPVLTQFTNYQQQGGFSSGSIYHEEMKRKKCAIAAEWRTPKGSQNQNEEIENNALDKQEMREKCAHAAEQRSTNQSGLSPTQESPKM